MSAWDLGRAISRSAKSSTKIVGPSAARTISRPGDFDVLEQPLGQGRTKPKDVRN
jgi:hypothetical protein